VSRSRWISFLVYSGLRLLVFAAVWLLVQILTPVARTPGHRGGNPRSAAGISLFVLDRPRGQVAMGVDAFMRRMNERIEASARAEDVDDQAPSCPRPPTTRGGGGDAQGDARPAPSSRRSRLVAMAMRH
jgi:hypothetical protein